MSGIRSLTIYRGSKHTHEVRLTQYDEPTKAWVVVNITNNTYIARLVRSQSDDTVLATWTVTKTNAAGGIMKADLTSNQTTALTVGTYYHYLFDDTNDIRILSGQVTVKG